MTGCLEKCQKVKFFFLQDIVKRITNRKTFHCWAVIVADDDDAILKRYMVWQKLWSLLSTKERLFLQQRHMSYMKASVCTAQPLLDSRHKKRRQAGLKSTSFSCGVATDERFYALTKWKKWVRLKCIPNLLTSTFM